MHFNSFSRAALLELFNEGDNDEKVAILTKSKYYLVCVIVNEFVHVVLIECIEHVIMAEVVENVHAC